MTFSSQPLCTIYSGSAYGIRAGIIMQQRGSTLVVALIMLVLLTLIAVSAINSTTSSIQMVGNAQFREEANAAAQKAIEIVISDVGFTTTPPAPQTVNVNGVANYTVTFTPAPKCISYKPVVVGDTGVPHVCDSSIGAVCFWTLWDITAAVNDANTGAGVVVHQGVKTIVGLGAMVGSCT